MNSSKCHCVAGANNFGGNVGIAVEADSTDLELDP
jgi:hypothetical protein